MERGGHGRRSCDGRDSRADTQECHMRQYAMPTDAMMGDGTTKLCEYAVLTLRSPLAWGEGTHDCRFREFQQPARWVTP